MKMVIAAGGTGGHLFPGIAVAEVMRDIYSDIKITFVGTERGIEQEILQREGLDHQVLRVGRIKGEGLAGKLRTVLTLPRSLWQAKQILDRIMPNIVFGIGGYSSGPMILAAFLLRIPRAILEPNAIPGFTNRMLSHFVTRVFIAFPETASFFGHRKIRLTGTPVRKNLNSQLRRSVDNSLSNSPGNFQRHFHIVVLGGSQGARSLNEAMIKVLPLLERSERPFKVTHQTGTRDYERIKEAYERSLVEHEVQSFIKDMASLYHQADLVVGRSGASTVAELIETQTPCVLVPYPFAADDHQRYNAQSIVNAGGGEMLLRGHLEEKLGERILYLASHEEELKRMRENLSKMRKIPAAQAVARECLELMHVSNS